MKRDGFLSRALLAFGLAVLLYVVTYNAIEHRRASKGPWQITFAQEATGAPAIIINQPAIGVTNVQISWAGESNNLANAPVTLTFGEARRTPFDVPFGKCIFLDTVFLPGTIVFEMSGHQIQLMPRLLTIDGVEHPWRSGENIRLTNAEMPQATVRKSPNKSGTRVTRPSEHEVLGQAGSAVLRAGGQEGSLRNQERKVSIGP